MMRKQTRRAITDLLISDAVTTEDTVTIIDRVCGDVLLVIPRTIGSDTAAEWSAWYKGHIAPAFSPSCIN